MVLNVLLQTAWRTVSQVTAKIVLWRIHRKQIAIQRRSTYVFYEDGHAVNVRNYSGFVFCNCPPSCATGALVKQNKIKERAVLQKDGPKTRLFNYAFT